MGRQADSVAGLVLKCTIKILCCDNGNKKIKRLKYIIDVEKISSTYEGIDEINMNSFIISPV